MTTLLLAFSLTAAASLHAEVTRFFDGNKHDVQPKLHGPVVDLVGGGTDDEAALQSMIDQVRGCSDCDTKLDVVILRSSGGNGYNELFPHLKGVNSTLTLLITDRESSNRADVVESVRRAEIVFFAGGDQCNYVRFFQGTKVQEAVEAVYARGGGVGGTSAGDAIQGDIVYDSCPNQSAVSKDVLLDPFSVDVSLSRFFHWRHLSNTITDTHFKQRDRMGRLIVFMARAIHDGLGKPGLLGLASSEKTSIIVGPDGKARVMGAGPAYLVLADHPAEVCEKGKPLTFRGVKVMRLESGATFDLTHRPETGYKTFDVVDGVLSADPY